MSETVDALTEIFTWVGIGGGILLALVALIMHLADGTWVPTRAVLVESPTGRLVRWFDDDGGVGEAHLTHEQEHHLGDVELADVYVRMGSHDRARLTKGSPAVRAVALLSAGLLMVGLVAMVISLVMLFVRG